MRVLPLLMLFLIIKISHANPIKPVKTTIKEVTKNGVTKVITKETYADGNVYTTVHDKKNKPVSAPKPKDEKKSLGVKTEEVNEDGVIYEETSETFSDGTVTVMKKKKIEPERAMQLTKGEHEVLFKTSMRRAHAIGSCDSSFLMHSPYMMMAQYKVIETIKGFENSLCVFSMEQPDGKKIICKFTDVQRAYVKENPSSWMDKYLTDPTVCSIPE